MKADTGWDLLLPTLRGEVDGVERARTGREFTMVLGLSDRHREVRG